MASSTSLPSYQGYGHFIVSSPQPGVAHVEINRPRKLNAFSQAVWLEFGRVFEQLSRDPDVRSIVLSGGGDRAFTAGLDVQTEAGSELFQPGQGDMARKAKFLRAHIEEFQNSISAMEKCEKRTFSDPGYSLYVRVITWKKLHFAKRFYDL